MKITNRIIIVFVAFLVVSCGKVQESKQGLLKLDAYPDSLITDLSYIASDIKYIPLETMPGDRIEAIDKLIIRKNRIYVSTVTNIYCFDSVGHYLNKLFNFNNKSEIIFDFDIGLNNEKLVLLLSGRLQIYSYYGGKFSLEEEIKTENFFPSELQFIPQTEYLLVSFPRIHGSEKTYNIAINSVGETIWQKKNYIKTNEPLRTKKVGDIIHYLYEGDLYFKEGMNDTIFRIEINPLRQTPAYAIYKRGSSVNQKAQLKNIPKSSSPSVHSIFETSRYIYFTYNSERFLKIFYDKVKNRKYAVDPFIEGLRDDISMGPEFNPLVFSDEYMYSFISAKKLSGFLSAKDSSENRLQHSLQNKTSLKKSGLSLKNDDNPIIVSVKLKN